MKTRASVAIVAVFFLIMLAVGCGLKKKGGEGDEVLATVDGATITLSEYKSALEDTKAQLPQGESLDPEALKAVKMNVLNQIKNIMGEYPDSEAFKKRMKEQKIDLASWKKEVEYQIMLDKLVKAVAGNDISVSPEDVEKYYNDHRDQYDSPTRVRALQIMVETKEQAQTIRDEIEKGADFSELAKKYSVSPDSEKGGDLGYFSEDEMPPAFSVVFSMKVGELSEVVQSEYGFHIFKIIDRRDAKVLTLDEARPEIEVKLKRIKTEEKYGGWFEEMRKKKKIEVNPSVLEKARM
jgi:parvulin-like peptidyl-prolyl isomerase